jgi:tetratricopeptide (TPR) repeat protein
MVSKSTRRSFLSLLAIIVHQATASDWLTLYRSGEEKLRLGMAEEASRDLRKSLRNAETGNAGAAQRVAILDALGRARFRAGQYREAAGYFETALQLGTPAADRLRLLVNAAQAYRELGKYRNAEGCAREASRIDPNDPHVWQLLGSVLVRSRKFEEAMVAEQKALALGSSTVAALAWSDLSVMEESQGHFAEAAAHLQRAIDMFPPGHERGRLLVNLGLLEHRARRTHAALTFLNEAIQQLEAVLEKAHPDLAHALESYAEVLRRAGRKLESRRAAKRAAEIRSSLGATVDWQDLRPPGRD